MKNNIIYKAFKELFLASKKMFVLSYFLTLLQGLSRVLPIIAIQQLFDHLHLITEENGIHKVALYIGLFMGARCLCHVIDLFTNYLYESYNMTAAHGMTKKLNQKLCFVNAIRFEEPEFLDEVTKAYRGTKSIRKFIDTWMLILLLYVPEILTIVIYLYRASLFLPFILVFIVIPEMIILKLQEKEYALQEENIASIQRKKEILEENAFELRSNIESRITGYLPLLVQKIKRYIREMALLDFKYQNMKNKLETIEKMVMLIGHMSFFAILLYCTIHGFITIGVFSALITSLDELFELMETILSVVAEGVSEELEKIRNFFKLTIASNEKREEHEEQQVDHIEKIEFRNVSFSYPGRTEKAIQNLSLTIKEGERIAIVGENGSGKSTFLKLLSGIYECEEGIILVNGHDIRNIRKQALYERFSAVFQNYGKYALNLNDNICLNQDREEKALEEVKSLAGLDELRKIEPEVILSREFGGIDLSGGQWQRIAIARSCYRNKEVYLLDEPTSAIDPNEEKTIYDLFGQIMKSKTSLIVTHRMGATKLADRIIVFHDGRISGDGNHKELMESCEDYRQLWNSQAKIYQEEFL